MGCVGPRSGTPPSDSDSHFVEAQLTGIFDLTPWGSAVVPGRRQVHDKSICRSPDAVSSRLRAQPCQELPPPRRVCPGDHAERAELAGFSVGHLPEKPTLPTCNTFGTSRRGIPGSGIPVAGRGTEAQTDPITLIVTALSVVTALSAGAGSAVQDGAAAALKGAYCALTGKAWARLGRQPNGRLVLDEHEKDPATWEAPLRRHSRLPERTVTPS